MGRKFSSRNDFRCKILKGVKNTISGSFQLRESGVPDGRWNKRILLQSIKSQLKKKKVEYIP